MKKNLLFSAIIMLGLVIAGCGNVDDSQIDRVEQNAADNKENNGMEADAPKASEISEDKKGQNIENGHTDNDDVNNETPNTGANNNEVANQGTVSQQDKDNVTEITQEEAKAIALKDAQVTESDVKKIRIERDRDDGRLIYDIDFYAGNKEYDYEIDLYTGEILNRDLDIEDDFYFEQNTQQNAQQNTQQNVQQNVQSTGLIGKADAMAIVLKKVPGATQQNVDIELDEDDGNWKYEGEIHYNKREYEFEINAKNGKILEWSEESIYD